MKDKSKENQTQNNSKIDDLDQTLNVLFEDPQNSKSSQISFSSESKAEWLEKLRRSVPLKIDAQGNWWHAGEAFKHKRLIDLFNRGIDIINGESVVRIGERWCYIECDITPFLITKLCIQKDDRSQVSMIHACLNNGQSLELSNLSIRDDILFAQLTPQRYARFSHHAQSQCATWLIEDETSKQYALSYHNQRLPIALED